MIYKMNKFFREWECYEKVYSFFKDHFFAFTLIKLCLYWIAIIPCFFERTLFTSLIRVIIYLTLMVIEYFLGNINCEKGEKISTILSRILLFLCLFCVIMDSLALFSVVSLPLYINITSTV